jgi:hypothetical protein
MYNIITQITVIFVWAPINCKNKMSKSVCMMGPNGYDVYNPLLLFVPKKLTFGTRRMSGKPLWILWNIITVNIQ